MRYMATLHIIVRTWCTVYVNCICISACLKGDIVRVEVLRNELNMFEGPKLEAEVEAEEKARHEIFMSYSRLVFVN